MMDHWTARILRNIVHRCAYSESGVCAGEECQKGVTCVLRPKEPDVPEADFGNPDAEEVPRG